MSTTVLDGDIVELSIAEQRAIRFDWDTNNLAAAATISSSTFTIAAERPEALAIASITRTLLVATVTTTDDHELLTGDYAAISGAAQADYNGTFAITKVSAKVFTYAVANNPATPATTTAALIASGGLGYDNASILSAAPYNARSTLLRLLGGRSAFLGRRYKVSNTIVTDETPTQTKPRYVYVVLVK